MNINQILYFLDIAETRSLNQSAANLYISPQGLSRAITQLERKVGITLFTRTNRGMALTEYGRQFLPHARLFWAAYEKFRQSVAHLSIEQATRLPATLNLQVPPLLTVTGSVHAVLKLVGQQFPHMHIDAGERNSHSILEYARSLTEEQLANSILVATVPEYHAQRFLANNRYTIDKLCELPIVARVNPEHPLARRKSITRAELARESITCFNEPVVEDIVHHLLDEHGGPRFTFMGSIGGMTDHFPEAVFLSAGLSPSGSAVSIPIQDTVRVLILAITALNRQPYMSEVVKCIERVLNSPVPHPASKVP